MTGAELSKLVKQYAVENGVQLQDIAKAIGLGSDKFYKSIRSQSERRWKAEEVEKLKSYVGIEETQYDYSIRPKLMKYVIHYTIEYVEKDKMKLKDIETVIPSAYDSLARNKADVFEDERILKTMIYSILDALLASNNSVTE